MKQRIFRPPQAAVEVLGVTTKVVTAESVTAMEYLVTNLYCIYRLTVL